MSTPTTLEERLTVVEAEIARLKQTLPQAPSARNWLEQMAGSMKDQPAFDEVIRLGSEIRQADRPPDEP